MSLDSAGPPSFKRQKLHHGGSLSQSFAALIDNDKFSDVTFQVGCDELDGMQTFSASRNILAARSPVFEAMLYGHMMEARPDSGAIIIPDVTPESFMIMLRFIYTDNVDTLTQDNVVNTLSCSCKYQVSRLTRACMKFIETTLSVENVCGYVSGPGRRNRELVRTCLGYIGRNGTKVLQSDGFLKLPKSLLIAILKGDELSLGSAAENEIKVFDACIRWAHHQKANNTSLSKLSLKEILHDLIPHIRFPLMTQEQLVLQVQPSGIIASEVVFEVLKYLMKHGETPVRFNICPRKIYLTDYEYDFDRNGVVYYLGSKARSTTYANPHYTGEVVVSMSHLGDRGELHNVVSRDRTYTWTSSDPAGWICVDLGENRRLRPTAYTLRHGCDNADDEEDDYIRNWAFEASCDGTNWTALRVHINDQNIHSEFGTHTWCLNARHNNHSSDCCCSLCDGDIEAGVVAKTDTEKCAAETDERTLKNINQEPDQCFESGSLNGSAKNLTGKYRMFRIRSTGLNSSDDHCLVICGIEIYGELYESLFDAAIIDKSVSENK
eukprot:644111_1